MQISVFQLGKPSRVKCIPDQAVSETQYRQLSAKDHDAGRRGPMTVHQVYHEAQTRGGCCMRLADTRIAKCKISLDKLSPCIVRYRVGAPRDRTNALR